MTVFCYHGVTKEKKDFRLERNFQLISDFQEHIKFFKKFKILHLEELLHELTSPGKSLNNTAAITFDDGYANNLIAWEILKKFKIPSTIFVSTGTVGRSNAIWTVELSLLLLQGEAECLNALNQVWQLKTHEERENAFQNIRYAMKAMPSLERRLTLEMIRGQFPKGETQRLLEKFPSLQMLSWEEIRQLADSGVEICSHGVDHEIHHQNQPLEIRQRELRESKAEIERHTGQPCLFFAYPNGDFAATSPQEVREAGYELAFTTQQGTIMSASNPYLLPRLEPPSSLKNFVRNFYWE